MSCSLQILVSLDFILENIETFFYISECSCTGLLKHEMGHLFSTCFSFEIVKRIATYCM